MVKRPKPLIPRLVYSSRGTVTILRIPANTPPEKAEAAMYQAKLMSEGESKTTKTFYYRKKVKGQISLF